MKRKNFFGFVLCMILCLSMNMTVLASETSYYSITNDNALCSEMELESSIMPRYTANLDFSELPVSHATHGNNRFNMNPGGQITCNFSSTGKFSLALYNYDTQTYWISDIVHSNYCNSVLTINEAGNYGVGVYNRDTKAITVTGSYTL